MLEDRNIPFSTISLDILKDSDFVLINPANVHIPVMLTTLFRSILTSHFNVKKERFISAVLLNKFMY